MSKGIKWTTWYHELEKYYEEHGNIDVPQKYETEEGLKLGQWLNTQRSAYKGIITNKITEDQIQLLNDLGMKWEIKIENWYTYYNALKKYYEEHGNINISVNYETEEGLRLGRWLITQRSAYKGKGKNKITDYQIQLLNNLGMIWEIQKKNWNNYYNTLKKYYEEHGNINISVNYETEEGIKLGLWLHRQRQAYKGNNTNKITEDQIQLLNDLGMKWEVQKENWDNNYYVLEKYYEEHGNIDVPRNYVTQDGVKLGKWLNTQRQAYRGKGKSKITEDQIQLLNGLNMEWNPRDLRLLKMKIVKENKDKYYEVLNDRLNYILTDISYEVSNEITEENQGELCKQIVKRMWR